MDIYAKRKIAILLTTIILTLTACGPSSLPSGDKHGEFLAEVSPDEVAGEPIPKTSTPIVGTGPRGEVVLGALCSQIATCGKVTGNAYIHSIPK